MKGKNRRVGGLRSIVMLVAAVMLIIGGGQCWFFHYRIDQLEKMLFEVRQTNKRMVSEIEARSSEKQTELLKARRKLDDLDGRLDENKKLSSQTDETRKKLEAVKALVEEHNRIVREVDDWKRLFPELFSGS